ncbi:hypothetical protein AX16_009878 [Volvariella volvacea WC 439]|nr:hypothetical protein AX16_009878 [Volvariella volvacea WC 439]
MPFQPASTSSDPDSSSDGYYFVLNTHYDYNYDPAPNYPHNWVPYSDEYFNPILIDPPRRTTDYIHKAAGRHTFNRYQSKQHHSSSKDVLFRNSPIKLPPRPSPHSKGLKQPNAQSPKRKRFSADRELPPHMQAPSQTPSSEYLEIANSPSTTLDDPTQSRKLLILDLNGTLVLRAPHVPRSWRNRASGHQQHANPEDDPTHPYNNPTAPRPLRTVYPRPYLGTFVEFLLHPNTKQWLDTMVWSSAQPHSVADMVEKSFGRRKDELKVIWARDTLGLAEKDYNRKIQTTKDLEKPWTQLNLPSTDTQPSSSDTLSTTQTKHSAKSTMLLDDSPLKAHLQPWNHVCIREYIAGLHTADVQLANLEEERRQATNPAKQSHADEGHAVIDQSGTGGEEGDPDTSSAVPGNAGSVASKEPNLSKTGAAPSAPAEYDPTLLAVIGVLDAARSESNIAGWLKGGGLWKSTVPSIGAAAITGEGLGADGGAGVEKVNSPVDEAHPQLVLGHDANAVVPLDAISTSPGNTDGRSEKRRKLSDDGEVVDSPLPGEHENVALKREHSRLEPAGGEKETMWFDDQHNAEYWVARGRKALLELGIEAVPGIAPGSP